MRQYIPEMMDNNEAKVIESLIDSLIFLKKEAMREGQSFIGYAIDDAIRHAKHIQHDKFTLKPHHNMP